MSALQHDTELLQRVKIQCPRPPGFYNPLSTPYADARYTQQRFVRHAVDFDRELLAVIDGPAAFGIKQRIEIGRCFIQQLLGLKAIEAQQPVSLIEPVFPQERRFASRKAAANALPRGCRQSKDTL